jgi:predicted TIM-barrel fold metal-dependent hydrolase
MTVNNDKEYYKQHPQYHMFQHPELPSYEEQLAARDRMLRKNPDLQFLASHLASLEWSVDEIAKFLDRFPMASVDLAERMGYLQYQGQYDQEKVREFVIRYQDRILYATDLMVIPGMEPEESARAANKKWLQDWNYLNSDLTLEVPELDEPVKGLALPKEVVEKIYHLNAEKLFPSAWKRN